MNAPMVAERFTLNLASDPVSRACLFPGSTHAAWQTTAIVA
jgi:hypothetical protein